MGGPVDWYTLARQVIGEGTGLGNGVVQGYAGLGPNYALRFFRIDRFRAGKGDAGGQNKGGHRNFRQTLT